MRGVRCRGSDALRRGACAAQWPCIATPSSHRAASPQPGEVADHWGRRVGRPRLLSGQCAACPSEHPLRTAWGQLAQQPHRAAAPLPHPPVPSRSRASPHSRNPALSMHLPTGASATLRWRGWWSAHAARRAAMSAPLPTRRLPVAAAWPVQRVSVLLVRALCVTATCAPQPRSQHPCAAMHRAAGTAQHGHARLRAASMHRPVAKAGRGVASRGAHRCAEQ